MTGISRHLNSSELKAKRILDINGWCPQRTRYFNYESSYGIPDFVCSNNRFVEVKKIQRGDNCISIHKGQLKKIKKLNKKDNQTYLMVFSDDLDEYDLYRIEHIKTE